MLELLEKIDNYSLSEKEKYFGKVDGLFIYQFDWFKNEVMDGFIEKLEDKNMQSHILNKYLKNNKLELDACINDSPSEKEFNKYRIKNLQEINKISNYSELVDCIRNDLEKNSFIREMFMEENIGSEGDFKKYCYLPRILKIYYNEYVSNKNKEDILNNKSNEELYVLYQNIGIDLKENNEFFKHNLLQLDKYMSIYCDKDNQLLLDDRIDKSFSILFGKRLLLEALKYMFMEEKIIGSLAFRVDLILEKQFLLLEERDFGASLTNDIKNLPEVSKFYDIDNPENGFWAFVDDKRPQISFEELCEDFDTLGDNVVTQLVHLEYEKKEDSYFIEHIDHEYIVYSLDEYEERLRSNKAKGHRKVKTFKINGAKIPFNYKYENEFFLYIVLISFFTNKELVKEYFENFKKI